MFHLNLAQAQPLSGKTIAEHRYAMATRGYNVIPGILGPEACDHLASILADAIQAYRPRPGVERSEHDRFLIHDLLCKELSIARLLEDPRLQQLIAPLLGDFWVTYAFTSSSLPPGGTNYGRRIHVDSARFTPLYSFNVGLIWALAPFSDSSGATEVLPGSHHCADLPNEQYFADHCVEVHCSSGDLIVFDGRLAHRAGVNRTGTWRHALTMNCCRPYMKQRLDWVRFVPEGIAGQLNEQARRLLGFDTRVPTSLDEFFVPAEQRLYKPGQG